MMLNKIIKEHEIEIPLTVPTAMHKIYLENYAKATLNSGRLLLFAGDQKIEHLNQDFYGEGVPEEASIPEHLFQIASKARIGVFATQLGLISRYGADYNNVQYLVKLNGKSNLVPVEQADPLSLSFTSVEEVVQFKKNTGLQILGVGYTVYLGSEYEAQMLAQAAQAIYQAHQQGMICVLWMYPRGKAIPEERAPHIIAGAAGVAVCLGADFVKVNPPEAQDGFASAQLLAQASLAAGRTRLVCSGGKIKSEEIFLQELYHQIHTGGASGAAVGRNLHQRTLADALRFCKAIAAIVIDDADLDGAKQLLV
jgi:fructose-bisphosphate aldolase/6-deoxy-5-ketofructose 1-phosphate synthase